MTIRKYQHSKGRYLDLDTQLHIALHTGAAPTLCISFIYGFVFADYGKSPSESLLRIGMITAEHDAHTDVACNEFEM